MVFLLESNKLNILVIDDEWNMRNLIRLYLSNPEWNIIEAESGLQAIKVFNVNQFHLVILDIMMPEMDGWEVCKERRKKVTYPSCSLPQSLIPRIKYMD